MIISYKRETNAADDDEMFEPGNGINPANKWVKILRKFYKQRGYDVKSHDFRVSQATDFYNETKARKHVLTSSTSDFIKHGLTN